MELYLDGAASSLDARMVAIKLTVAHWVMPSGRILDHDGIIPDYIVTIPTSTPIGSDPQLAKALQIVQSQIGK